MDDHKQNHTQHHRKHAKATGAVDTALTTTSGATITSATSADGLVTTSQASCELTVRTSRDLDPWFGHTYLAGTTQTTPAGLMLTTSHDREYVDNDQDGLAETITDPLQRVTMFTNYDAEGRLKWVERANGSVLAYDYDENGNRFRDYTKMISEDVIRVECHRNH